MDCVGLRPVIVHGGGKAISARMKEAGLQPEFLNGLRVTCEDAIAIVEDVLNHRINPRMVDLLQSFGCKARGIHGEDILRVRRHTETDSATGAPLDWGFVGDVRDVDAEPVKAYLASEIIPLVTPLGRDPERRVHNMNADEAAASIARALRARKLVFLSDVPGLLADAADKQSVISSVSVAEAEDLIERGVIAGGMLPKIGGAVNAVRAGVRKTHIIDSAMPHSLLLEIFTDRASARRSWRDGPGARGEDGGRGHDERRDHPPAHAVRDAHLRAGPGARARQGRQGLGRGRAGLPRFPLRDRRERSATAHPKHVQAVRRQAGRLVHVSNLYYTENQPRLAQALAERFQPGGKCFFCNSGAEANEGLIKLARLWGTQHGGRHEIMTMHNSFHGRTLATLTATGQDKVQKGFEPLPEGFGYADFNDLASCRAAVGDRTAAILVEAVQGEGGVLPAAPGFLEGLRALCDERGLLLLCDEVQCGMGRTGTGSVSSSTAWSRTPFRWPRRWAAASRSARSWPARLADVFQPGHHATTFGGTPLACAAALSVVEAIEEERLLDHAAAMGALFAELLRAEADRHAFVREVRGRGLMIGMVLDRPAKDLETLLREDGLIALATAGDVVRFLPPLNVRETEVRRAARIVRRACRAFARQTG